MKKRNGKVKIPQGKIKQVPNIMILPIQLSRRIETTTDKTDKREELESKLHPNQKQDLPA